MLLHNSAHSLENRIQLKQSAFYILKTLLVVVFSFFYFFHYYGCSFLVSFISTANIFQRSYAVGSSILFLGFINEANFFLIWKFFPLNPPVPFFISMFLSLACRFSKTILKTPVDLRNRDYS